MATAIHLDPEQALMQDDWSDVTPEEAEELERACDEADEHQRQGIGVPVEAVLPRFRSRG